MKRIIRISSVVMVFVMFFVCCTVEKPNVAYAKSSQLTDFACYKNCKLSDSSKKVNVSIKNGKVVVDGWIYNGVEFGDKYKMKWQKISKSFKIASDCEMNDELYNYFRKKYLSTELKRFGKDYECITFGVHNNAIYSISLQKINSLISNSSNIPKNTEYIYVSAKDCAGHGAGEIAPKQYATFKIEGNKLKINGVISCESETDTKILKKANRTLIIDPKCKGVEKVKKNKNKFNVKDGLPMLELYIKNGKVMHMELNSGMLA